MHKSPYRGYTEKELYIMENNYWCFIMGGDYVIREKAYIFTPKEVRRLYNNMLQDLLELARDNNAKDSKYALDLIGSLRVVPFRLH